MEKFRSLRFNNSQKLIHVRTTPVKTRNELVPCSFVEFRRERKRSPEATHAGLTNIIGGNILARFYKAAPFAVFKSLARWQHLLDVFTSHDGVILHGWEFLNGLLSQHIRKVLTVQKRHTILGTAIRRSFKHSYKGCRCIYGKNKNQNSEK